VWSNKKRMEILILISIFEITQSLNSL